MEDEAGLNNLLELDGVVIDQEDGFWVKFVTAYDLLRDFFEDVDQVMREFR